MGYIFAKIVDLGESIQKNMLFLAIQKIRLKVYCVTFCGEGSYMKGKTILKTVKRLRNTLIASVLMYKTILIKI